MATQMHIQTFSHLESMVSKPTWKDILLELIAGNRIDPWNIDILELSDAFIKKVREMEKMDFAVQANVILAASILLKYKSNYLKMLSVQAELPAFMPEESPQGYEEVPPLTLSSRIPPKRQITLDELIVEMERIIKYDEQKVHVPRGSIVETVDLELPERDIESDMQKIMDLVRANTDSEGWSLFSRLREGADLQETVYLLLCLLHLVQSGSLDIRQDDLFGEIFICLLRKEPENPKA
ncbi:MAG TPA: segregation/condensation protein A [Candidatus Bilamarchaeum sp.]|nr:segregation/condensation protein A [Candidatus Bilamarchaeum sp.]